MIKSRISRVAFSGLVLLFAPVLCQAGFIYFQTFYSVNLTDLNRPVTNILVQEYPGANYAQRLNFPGPNAGIAAAGAVTVLDDPFLNTDPTPNTISLGLGIVQDLPNDAAGQKHAVLFMNHSATLLSNGLSWGAAFPGVNEDQLIADLELGTSGGFNWGNDFNTLAPGLFNAAQFMNSLASPGGIPGPGGSHTSPYFALPPPQGIAVDFDVVAFSTGRVIGTGSVTQSQFGAAATPEPGTFLTLSLALGGVAWVRRRRAMVAASIAPAQPLRS